MNALQGCINQDLFNGVWRLKVTDQHQQETDDDYWYTEFTASNGSKHDLYFSDFIEGDGISVVDSKGNVSDDNYIFQGDQVAGVKLPPGGSTKLRIATRLSKITPPLTKVLIQVDTSYTINNSGGKKLPFVKTPNFRIDLTCKK